MLFWSLYCYSEQISHIVLVFPLLPLNKKMPTMATNANYANYGVYHVKSTRIQRHDTLRDASLI